ncbi:hypothetical protein [Nesterenkonia suensis]
MSAASPEDGPAEAAQPPGFITTHRWGLSLIAGLTVLFATLVVTLVLTSTSVSRSPQHIADPGDARGGDPSPEGPDLDARPDAVADEDLLPPGGAAFSDGESMVVGEDIVPGSYRQDPDSGPEDATCFYVIYADASESTVLRTGAEDRGIAVLEEGDVVDSRDCGEWLPVEATYPESPATQFGTGMYVIGGHIEPGTYELTWDVDSPFCWWDIFADLRGEGTVWDSGIIPREDPGFGEPLVITLDVDDHLVFTTETCGTWTQVD